MQKLAPRISVIGWCLWLAVSLAFAGYHHQSSSSELSLMSVLRYWVGFGIGGGAIAISAVLCQRPQRALAFFLAGLSLFVFLKFYLGVILFKMAQIGGLTFSQSVADYWQHVSQNVFLLVVTVPLGIFLGVSVIFWPLYGLLYGSQGNDHVANQNPSANR
jgi:hypothetical protein